MSFSASPTVSVIIPTYNREKIIFKSINSVLNQTFEDWELIIVDDGSTDNTYHVLKENFLDDPRIRYIQRPKNRPKGANACRNIGAEESKGKYLAFLDSDDEWLPFHLKYKLHILNDSEANFNFGAFLTQRKHTCIENNCLVKGDENDVESYLVSKQSDICTPTFVLNRKSFLSVKFDEYLGKHQDWDFALRYCNGRSFVVNHKPTVKINISAEGMSSSQNHNATFRFISKHEGKLKKETYKKFLTNVGLNTYLNEGKNFAFKKYSKKLRKLRSIDGIRYFFVAYVFSTPFSSLYLRPLFKICTAIIRWKRGINRQTF